MRIQITQRNIDNGRSCSPTACPLALAIKDKCPESKIYVSTFDAQIDDRLFEFDGKTRSIVLRYDTNKYMEPFTVKMESGKIVYLEEVSKKKRKGD